MIQPDTFPGLRDLAPPAGKKPRRAKSWTDAEIAAADAVIAEWNRVFDRVEGGWRAHRNYPNRHLVIFLLRDQAELPEPQQFSVDEIRRAIRAYRDDPVNKRLGDGAGVWTRFATWFARDKIAENIDHQLTRIGYTRPRGPAGSPPVKTPPPSPQQLRARRLLDATPWPFTAESAIQADHGAGLALRDYLQRELDKGNPWSDRKMREAFESTLARYRRQLAALDRFEALRIADPAHHARLETRAQKGFELISNRPPRPDSAADATRLQAIALALFEKENL